MTPAPGAGPAGSSPPRAAGGFFLSAAAQGRAHLPRRRHGARAERDDLRIVGRELAAPDLAPARVQRPLAGVAHLRLREPRDPRQVVPEKLELPAPARRAIERRDEAEQRRPLRGRRRDREDRGSRSPPRAGTPARPPGGGTRRRSPRGRTAARSRGAPAPRRAARRPPPRSSPALPPRRGRAPRAPRSGRTAGAAPRGRAARADRPVRPVRAQPATTRARPATGCVSIVEQVWPRYGSSMTGSAAQPRRRATIAR